MKLSSRSNRIKTGLHYLEDRNRILKKLLEIQKEVGHAYRPFGRDNPSLITRAFRSSYSHYILGHLMSKEIMRMRSRTGFFRKLLEPLPKVEDHAPSSSTQA